MRPSLRCGRKGHHCQDQSRKNGTPGFGVTQWGRGRKDLRKKTVCTANLFKRCRRGSFSLGDLDWNSRGGTGGGEKADWGVVSLGGSSLQTKKLQEAQNMPNKRGGTFFLYKGGSVGSDIRGSPPFVY